LDRLRGCPGRIGAPVATVAPIALVLAGFAPAPAAAAKPARVVAPAHDEYEFSARGSNGYRLFFIGDTRGELTVIVEKGPGRVTYELPARVRDHRFEARYGDVIDLSVRFHPTGPRKSWPVRRLHGHCVGRKPVTRRGELVGTIAFHGERGYTELDTTRHRAAGEHDFRLLCRRPGRRRAGGSNFEETPEQVVAERPEGAAETWFRALSGNPTLMPSPRWNFEATRAELPGRVRIERKIVLETETGATLSTPGVRPVIAEIAPAAPFSGTAEFRREAGATSWTGSLGVEFPGLGVVPLTGKGFTAADCVGAGERATRPCKRSPLAPVFP
jgi:hypothetical protein